MKRLIATLLFMLIAPFAFAGGTGTATATSGTVTYTIQDTVTFVKKVAFTCTSDASGYVDITTTDFIMDGEILRVTFDPNDGTTSPSANYDVYVYDTDGYDVLLGFGVNRSASATEHICPLLFTDASPSSDLGGRPMVLCGTIRLYAENVGASNGFKVYIFWR